jgi:hypothetical protein
MVDDLRHFLETALHPGSPLRDAAFAFATGGNPFGIEFS